MVMASDYCIVCKMRPVNVVSGPSYRILEQELYQERKIKKNVIAIRRLCQKRVDRIKSAIADTITRWQALRQYRVKEPHHQMSGRICKGGGYPTDSCICRFNSCSWTAVSFFFFPQDILSNICD
ncbi:hypothetical protein TNCV_3782361 [Trichonephila clavipes]|nr:hypothetical protein TNCV_3782361 [Trichonephila clavipes]